MKEWSKAESPQSGCKLDNTKACSSSRMTKVAANLGCKRGFVVDLTTEDENDRKRDLSDFEIRKQADGEIEGGSSVFVVGSITSFYHVRHDPVTELQKTER